MQTFAYEGDIYHMFSQLRNRPNFGELNPTQQIRDSRKRDEKTPTSSMQVPLPFLLFGATPYRLSSWRIFPAMGRECKWKSWMQEEDSDAEREILSFSSYRRLRIGWSSAWISGHRDFCWSAPKTVILSMNYLHLSQPDRRILHPN